MLLSICPPSFNASQVIVLLGLNLISFPYPLVKYKLLSLANNALKTKSMSFPSSASHPFPQVGLTQTKCRQLTMTALGTLPSAGAIGDFPSQ